jgi:hypothetical protein
MTPMIIAKGARCAITIADIWCVISFSKVYKGGRSDISDDVIGVFTRTPATPFDSHVTCKSNHATHFISMFD